MMLIMRLMKDMAIPTMSMASTLGRLRRLVPYDTIHKGTSKCHKTDEKIPHFVVHFPTSMFGFFINYPTPPSRLSIM